MDRPPNHQGQNKQKSFFELFIEFNWLRPVSSELEFLPNPHSKISITETVLLVPSGQGDVGDNVVLVVSIRYPWTGPKKLEPRGTCYPHFIQNVN